MFISLLYCINLLPFSLLLSLLFVHCPLTSLSSHSHYSWGSWILNLNFLHHIYMALLTMLLYSLILTTLLLEMADHMGVHRYLFKKYTLRSVYIYIYICTSCFIWEAVLITFLISLGQITDKEHYKSGRIYSCL